MSTLSSTFFLKEPKSKKDTLILFSCYFKFEEKKFVYSTGEKIHPDFWDAKSHQPKNQGKKSPIANIIRTQINRYPEHFDFLQARCKTFGEVFTSKLLKDEFDKKFKKAFASKNSFFDVYDKFMAYKIKVGDWSPSTIIRYTNIKNILEDFEQKRSYKLTFNSITSNFYAEFTDYCMKDRKHINNTYSRNLGLFKTFMLWSLNNGFTHNEEFRKFEKKKTVVTEQLALKIEDLQNLMKLDFETSRLEKVRDVFVFACVTGMRFGELKFISKKNVIKDEIHLKEEKDVDKPERRIPLNDISKFLLRKYEYKLPLIANQKHNEYIKEVFIKAGYTWDTEKITTKGKESIRETLKFHDRVSSHTARRTFITMMKRQGVSDKLIASITGHKDMKTLNQYYQIDDDARNEAVEKVFDVKFDALKKVN
ncbi:tyrosine-type recombinase/integrase [Zobellia russellii]|uniref:tyrosine-type recombinase/integrase n=1 Tax=Zobellia russellii TaxID=248907 RepID=UPI001BFFC7D9|nr:tyrosine-type recombinase/integrase [Zobellia russellii]MBT9187771.1 tyrosine-type recombinase/integrase [Zobellia russellii]